MTSARALTTPALDFWLLGGLSAAALLVLLVMKFLGVAVPENIGWWAFYAAMAVNFPHFMYSYQLFYAGFFKRFSDPEMGAVSRARMAAAGFFVPAALAGYALVTYATKNPFALGYMIAAMFFTVGWHYVKQGYGVLVTLSVYKGCFFLKTQKMLLWGNAYIVWIYVFMRANTHASMLLYYDVPYPLANLPPAYAAYGLKLALISTVFAALTLLKARLIDRKNISLNGVCGYAAAIYLWMALVHAHPAYTVIVPFFHSLQYLPFVYKYKRAEIDIESDAARDDVVRAARLGLFILLGVVAGTVFMDRLPKYLDLHVSNWTGGFSNNFFLIAFLVFINVHHFFIDAAFWRRDNKDAQKYLFRA